MINSTPSHQLAARSLMVSVGCGIGVVTRGLVVVGKGRGEGVGGGIFPSAILGDGDVLTSSP